MTQPLRDKLAAAQALYDSKMAELKIKKD